MTTVWHSPAEDGDRPIVRFRFPNVNPWVTTSLVSITVLDKTTDTAVATTTGVAVQSAADPEYWLYDLADITGINLETVGIAQLLIIAEATLSSGADIKRSVEASFNGEKKALHTTVGALNDLSIADVQTAMDNQGYTAVRALLLDNLDVAISSLNDLSIADVQTALTNQGYTVGRAINLDNLDASISSVNTNIAGVSAAIAALNDLSQADVQAAMTAQGYTIARAALLDNLDVAVSTACDAVLVAIAALNDLSIADVQTAMDNQGYTTPRAVLLDNLSTILTTVEKVRKVTTNRVLVNGTDTQIDVYEDNGTTVAFSFSLDASRRDRTPI